MKIFFLLLVFTDAFQYCHPQTVTIPELGTLIGSKTKTMWTNQTVLQFLGVKYAKAPSRERRFKPPELEVPWTSETTGKHDVSKYARSCPVLIYYQNMTETELREDLEDCLTMDIYTKNISASNAVLVYIHGGAFDRGASFRRPPNYLLEKEIVYVVPQYRLGVFGFMSTNTDEINGNLGLLDTIASLEWVQRFIHYFGGDPKKVTIWGGSSSAVMVSAMLFSPKVPDNLFRGMIIQSGSYFGPFSIERDPVRSTRMLAEYANCTPRETIEDVNKCLREGDVLTLLKAYDQYKIANNNFGARLTINDVLPLSPSDIILNPALVKSRNISLLIGGTRDDGMKFLPGNFEWVEKQAKGDVFTAINLLAGSYDIDDPSGSLSAYLAAHLFTQEQMQEKNLTKVLLGVIDIANTINIKAPTLQAMHFQTRDYPTKTFLYSFEYDGQFAGRHDTDSIVFDVYSGIVHSDENVYMFPFPDYKTNLNDADKRMAHIMVDLWTSFMIDGVPSSDKTPVFPPVTNFSGPFLRINTVSTIGQDFLKDLSIATRPGNHAVVVQFAAGMNGIVLLWLYIFWQVMEF